MTAGRVGGYSVACLVLTLCLTFKASPVYAQANLSWWPGTAVTLPEGAWGKGLFDPLRHGQTENLEWAIHPVLFALLPNLALKLSLNDLSEWRLATRASFSFPTPLLRFLTREGTGGILSPDPTIERSPSFSCHISHSVL